MIENYQQQVDKIESLCLSKINYLNSNDELKSLLDICTFNKGIEIGSANYHEKEDKTNIHYIRVGDLLTLSDTYIDNNLKCKMACDDDVLIAFDGAPGRIAIGLNGAYSSGIYKVECNNNLYKGLVYFELKSSMNQLIIKNHSQGTTILHASKSIEHLIYANCNNDELLYFNSFYNGLISLKAKINKLKEIKSLLLNKYFN